VYVECPFCGKESSSKDTHFFYDIRGGKCFVCGERKSVFTIIKHLGLDNGKPIAPRPVQRKIKKKTPPPVSWKWLEDAWQYVNTSTFSDSVAPAWIGYRPLSEETRKKYFLGYNNFPPYSSRCKHMRLLVPLITGNDVIGFRGRAVDCDCGKWLSASGTKQILYNGSFLMRSPSRHIEFNLGISTANPAHFSNRMVWITENPIDALMMQERGYLAVATLGVTMWQDGWTEALLEFKPTNIIVCYDNDIAGNGGCNEKRHAEFVKLWQENMRRSWKKNHPNDDEIYMPAEPTPNGVKLTNKLLEAGLKTTLYRWPADAPHKYDIGELLMSIACPI
jgi:hypothetical protein